MSFPGAALAVVRQEFLTFEIVLVEKLCPQFVALVSICGDIRLERNCRFRLGLESG